MTYQPQQATDPEGPTGRLCHWLSGLSTESVPADVRERAKHLLLDGVACAIVGAQLPWSRTAAQIVRTVEGEGTRTVIGWDFTTSTPGAALLNGTFIQGFELDDFHPRAPLHSASLVLPALLACAEHLSGGSGGMSGGMSGSVSGERFVLGAVAGFEVGPRVGLGLHGIEMLSRGWHSGAVFGTHAAAAATGVLLGLDGARFEDALGLAGTQSAGLMAAQYEAMCKRMHHGFSARNGLYSALLAAGGYTGIKRVFERPYGGFLSTFGEGHAPDASQVCLDLGRRWETRHIVVKAYAAMGGLHNPLDALADLQAQRRFSAQEVERIDVEMSHATYHHGWWVPERPLTPIGAQMNVGYALAVAVIDGEALVQQFTPARIDRDDVWDLIPRITAHHQPDFDAPDQKFRVRLTVLLRDGTRLHTERGAPRGLERLMSNEDIVAKYRHLTNGLLPAGRQAAIERAVLGLDRLPDVRELGTLLGGAVAASFE
jgi:2-methylcitrate dehydratase PrpD